MPMQLIDGGGVDRLVTAMQVIDGGGVDRVIQEMRVIDAAGTDRLVYSVAPPMSLSVAPSSVAGGTTGGPAITDAATATPVGGIGPYTYVWTVISYDAAVSPTVNSPTSASTTFRQTGVPANDAVGAIFRCTATDSFSSTASANVSAYFYDYSGGVIP